MFTLNQLHKLFNLQLRRSDVRKRLDENDSATRVLEDKVAELERWRLDLEQRFGEEKESTVERFARVNKRIT